jgi:hypothetical protein
VNLESKVADVLHKANNIELTNILAAYASTGKMTGKLQVMFEQ